MNGFLPINPPLKEYGSSSDSASLLRIKEVANDLPKLLLTDRVERTIKSLSTDDFDVSELLDKNSEEEINLAMSQLSFIAHAYILGGSEPKSLLPKVIAKPWVDLSKALARPPVLSYASYCLHNWYLLDSEEPIGLDNVALINNFLGGIDEDWFVTIHVCIEDAASKAIYSKDDYNIYLAIRHLSDIKENPRTTFDDIKNAEIALDACISNTESISEAAYLARLNWWTVEYGLVGSIDNPKIYGAGLLSSVSESYNAIFGDVKKIPLSLDCINYSYDITEQQPQLFIADDFEHLSKVLKDFTLNMAYNTGGIASVKKAIESESICTYKFDTGLQVSGIPVDFKGSDRIDFYKFYWLETDTKKLFFRGCW